MSIATVTRTDSSVIGHWWWTVDRWSLAATAILFGLGVIMIAAASPPVATRIGLSEYHFIQRHILMLPLAGAILFAVSLLQPRSLIRISLFLLAGSILATAATLVVGAEVKGATRWLHLPGMSIQPSEFLKPAFIVVAAWLFSIQRTEGAPGTAICIALYLLIAGLVLLQPDLGMAVVLTAVWGVQFFLAGLPMILVILLGIGAVGGMVLAYQTLPHVASRIDRFLDPASGDNYQISRSLEAFANGGWWGVGPGEGVVKLYLPDAHADFIFAVAGEEFGMIWCLVLVALFAFIVLRAFSRIAGDGNLFVLLAGTGLAAQFGLQALINMGSSLHLIPTKGMTLPFISYGGSSLLATAFGLGLLFALTRRRPAPGPSWTPPRRAPRFFEGAA